MTNKEKFAATYAQAFRECYAEKMKDQSDAYVTGRIEKLVEVACGNFNAISIDGAAFKLTAKRLKIKYTRKAFKEFIEAQP